MECDRFDRLHHGGKVGRPDGADADADVHRVHVVALIPTQSNAYAGTSLSVHPFAHRPESTASTIEIIWIAHDDALDRRQDAAAAATEHRAVVVAATNA